MVLSNLFTNVNLKDVKWKVFFLLKTGLLEFHLNKYFIDLHHLTLFILNIIWLMWFIKWFVVGTLFNVLWRQTRRWYLIGIKHVWKTLKNMAFVGYYRIISIKEYVKMLHIHSEFWKNFGNRRTACGAVNTSIPFKKKKCKWNIKATNSSLTLRSQRSTRWWLCKRRIPSF